MSRVLERTRAYFAALEHGVTGDELAAFYAPDVIQEEFPNRLMPHGARRDLAGILAAAERGKAVGKHRYEILGMMAEGDRVAVEFLWSCELAVAVGSLAAGAEMSGRFASFIEFRDEKIVSQRSYDCFNPW
jgi:ketosteroid isomerase-like protein